MSASLKPATRNDSAKWIRGFTDSLKRSTDGYDIVTARPLEELMADARTAPSTDMQDERGALPERLMEWRGGAGLLWDVYAFGKWSKRIVSPIEWDAHTVYLDMVRAGYSKHIELRLVSASNNATPNESEAAASTSANVAPAATVQAGEAGYAFRCDGKLWVVTDPEVAAKWKASGFEMTPVFAPQSSQPVETGEATIRLKTLDDEQTQAPPPLNGVPAKPQIIEIFAIYETTDERGSRAHKPCGFAAEAVSANKFAAGKGWYGGPGTVVIVPALIVDGETYPLLTSGPVVVVTSEEYTRQAALAKLTKEERGVLGL